MKKLLILFACLPLLGACTQTEPVSGNRAAAIVAEIHNPRSKNVVVASHRGDWRNYPLEGTMEEIGQRQHNNQHSLARMTQIVDWVAEGF